MKLCNKSVNLNFTFGSPSRANTQAIKLLMIWSNIETLCNIQYKNCRIESSSTNNCLTQDQKVGSSKLPWCAK